MISDLLTFAGVIALGQFSPGPDMLLITRTALAQGRSAGWWTTAGITTGLCVHATVAVFGMAYLMAQGGWLTGSLRWVAAGYLAYLGFRLLPTAFVVMRQGRRYGEGGSEKGRSAYLRGLLCNILNPKVAIIFAAVVTEFVTGDRPAWWSPVLWIIIVGQGFLLWLLYVWLLQFPLFRNGYQRAGPWFDSAFGAGLLTLAVLLAVNSGPSMS
ncbi:MAG: LysE family translocator [Roseibacillus sp.]